MVRSATRLIQRAADVAARAEASDDERLASGLFLLVTVLGAAAGAFWGIGYTLLGRPVSGLVPGAFAVMAVFIAIWLIRTKELGRLRELLLLLILILPALLQATLGGFVKGSAVIVWSFLSPLNALVLFGARAGWQWLSRARAE